MRDKLPPGIPPGTDPRLIVDDGVHPPYVAAAKQPPPPSRPGASAPSQPQERQGPGKVGRTINIGIDIGYAAIFGLLTLLGVATLFIAHQLWWSLAAIAFFGYFTYRNISNIIVHKGAD
jgi:hypothetical protein